MDIVQKPLPLSQYFQNEYPKKQIVLHHTASGSALSDLAWWAKDPQKIATAFIIERSGQIMQAFSSKYWAYHLGISSKLLPDHLSTLARYNIVRQRESIGVELVSWGGLNLVGDTYRNYRNGVVDESEVIKLHSQIRGYFYYQKYTQAQIDSLRELLDYLCQRYDIPEDYQSDMWNVSRNALEGKKGIFTHVSYRIDKSDCVPQVELVEMLKGLK